MPRAGDAEEATHGRRPPVEYNRQQSANRGRSTLGRRLILNRLSILCTQGPMSLITDVAKAKPLFALYARARIDQSSVSDKELLEAIKSTYWGTNASCAVQQIFAVIAPACLLRPHLTQELIRAPIEAIIACGEEAPESVVKAGAYLLMDESPYVSPDPYGMFWLENVLPTLEPVINEVFPIVLRACSE